jgi:hypothetical protein
MPLLSILISAIFVIAACSSSSPALPSDRESTTNLQTNAVAFRETPPDSQRVDDFTANVLPIFAKCQPCHFSGGKVYAQLPFDNPKTIRHLGAKLFSRIQDEKEQAIIRAFLARIE